jgi:peptidoglycan/LPS O-acetylase OafA/YrhL
MNDAPGNPKEQADTHAPSFARIVAVSIGGMVMMLIGVAAIVGGLILHFAEKAERFVLFPYTGRFTILIGIGVITCGFVLTGTRTAVRFGVVILVIGIGMLAFGFIKFAEPSLRFFAPLGFFVSLAGVLIIWGTLDYAKHTKTKSDAERDLPV